MGECRTLAGKSALITGAAQGLGLALAERLAQHGADVALVDLQAGQVEAEAQRIGQAEQVRATGLAADVTDEAQVAAAFDAAVQQLGGIDIVVANAGILISGPICDFEVAAWRKVIEVNLVGYMVVAKHAARVMIPRGGGAIVQINSKSGKTGSSKNSAYAASKFGGIGLTQSLALELAEHNIRVNAVCPGNLLDSPLWVDSLYEQYARRWGKSVDEVRQMYVDKVPMRRGCSYDDVAGAVLFLCSDAATYMTGQALNVDGGQTMH